MNHSEFNSVWQGCAACRDLPIGTVQGGLRRADAIESHRAVGRPRVGELELAGRTVRHGAQHRPVGQRQQQIRGGQNRCGVFTRIRCNSRGYVGGVTGYSFWSPSTPIRYDNRPAGLHNHVGHLVTAPMIMLHAFRSSRGVKSILRTGSGDAVSIETAA